MQVTDPATAVRIKREQLIAYLRMKAGTFDKKVFEDKIAAALNNPKLDQGNVMLGALASKVANSQRLPKESQEVKDEAAKFLQELDALTKAATAPAKPAVPVPSGKGKAAAPQSMFGCPLKDPPLGFANKAQYDQMMKELQGALAADGILVQTLGVRGSSVTGRSMIKGTLFHKHSDIDVFFILAPDEAARLKVTESEEIPGFIHPNKIMDRCPNLAAWSEKWEKTLGRKVTPGAFSSKTKFQLAANGKPKQPYITYKG